MRTANIINMYMVRHFVAAFLVVQAIIMGIILMFDVVELLRRTASKNTTFFEVFQMAIFKLPQTINVVLPFAIMIAAILVFWKLTRSQELVVMRASGISVWEFVMPILIVTFIFGVLDITMVNPVASAMYKKYEKFQNKEMIKTTNPLFLNEKGLWLRDHRDDGTQIVFNAKNVRQDGMTLHLQDISIMELNQDDVFKKGIEAKTGELVDSTFKLIKVWIVEPERAGTFLKTLDYKTNLTIGKIQENFASPQTLSFWQLPKFISFYENSGFSAAKHKLHLYSLYALPLLLCAFVLVSAVFSLSLNIRTGGITVKIVSALAAGFLIFVLSKITYALGLSNTLPLSLAAFAPAIITLLLAVTALLHFEDG